MEELDLNGKLLRGKPIEIDIGKVYAPTIGEIENFGFTNYYNFISLITIDSNEIMNSLQIVEKIPPFQFIIANCIHDQENKIKNIILNGLSLILKQQVTFCTSGYFIIGDITDNNFLDEKNFDNLVDIIKKQNCIFKKKAPIISKKEQDYFKRLEETKKKYAKNLEAQGKNDSTNINDIISAVASKHPSINLLNIYDLTMYQLINKFKRLNMIDDFNISIESLMAGADKKEVNLKHWSKKIIY